MTASECVRLFELHHRLLVIYEPQEALMWLVKPQQQLDMRIPCELLAEKGGFSRIMAVISQVTDSAYT